jgi:hypothetical protein
MSEQHGTLFETGRKTEEFTRMRIRALILAMAATAVGSTTAVADSSTIDSLTETVTVWQVDMSGKPPYKRERVQVPVVDTARLEVTGEPVEMVTVWTVDRSGKPPFKRTREEVPVIDVAALSPEDVAEEGTVFRGRPPFKRHR